MWAQTATPADRLGGHPSGIPLLGARIDHSPGVEGDRHRRDQGPTELTRTRASIRLHQQWARLATSGPLADASILSSCPATVMRVPRLASSITPRHSDPCKEARSERQKERSGGVGFDFLIPEDRLVLTRFPASRGPMEFACSTHPVFTSHEFSKKGP